MPRELCGGGREKQGTREHRLPDQPQDRTAIQLRAREEERLREAERGVCKGGLVAGTEMFLRFLSPATAFLGLSVCAPDVHQDVPMLLKKISCGYSEGGVKGETDAAQGHEQEQDLWPSRWWLRSVLKFRKG